MTDIINKILGVVIAFTLLVGAPLVITALQKDLTMNRSVLNEMTNLIDKVSDNGRLSEQDLSEFYVNISSHGMAMDGTISRYMKVVNPDAAGGTVTSYMLVDDHKHWNTGDIIKVRVRAVDFSGAQRLQNYLLRLTPPKFDQTLAGMIRK
ncbi:hypothetical protein D3P09_16765 [Paenibacillus pinisoli]|uniref:Uncharacterized protein n=1 Tax=Paenibacillus pinisoli TaxID=1276110 RepID=A0A3A6PZH7_9BACL|nr:hypothetical protein [Paenibacillus pinisoli]RJX39144.1 hypothetical protein D3P09_16765 [Paenibacillus pinisoli]